MSELDFNWGEKCKCSFTGEKLPPDSLGRSIQAEYLTNYLISFKDRPYVVNIDSEWGTGKTYFLKRWANTLKKQHPVVYFDAWSNDFNKEPLLLVLSEIVDGLKKLFKTDQNGSKKYEELKNTFIQVLKNVTPAVTKGLVKKWFDVDVMQFLQEAKEQGQAKDSESEPTKSNVASDGKIMGDIAESVVKELLTLHSEQKVAVSKLKEKVKSLLDLITDPENSNVIEKLRKTPLFIFIDELDRCRPDFAIEILEAVKHIFNIDNVVFLIATDTEQLQHSINAVYGQNFDSQRYLRRFFDRSFSLSFPDLKAFVAIQEEMKLISERFIANKDKSYFLWDSHWLAEFVASLFSLFGIDLRTATQILARTVGILSTHKEERSVLLLVMLECVRAFNLASYEIIVKKMSHPRRTNPSEIDDLFYKPMAAAKIINRAVVFPSLHFDKVNVAKTPSDYLLRLGTLNKVATLSTNNLDYSVSSLLSIIADLFHPEDNAERELPHYSSPLELALLETEPNKDRSQISRFDRYIKLASALN